MGKMCANTRPSAADAQRATIIVAGARALFKRFDSKHNDDERLSERDRGRIVARALHVAPVSRSNIGEVVHGANDGSPDAWGAAWAAQTGTDVKPFSPDWDDLTHPNARVKENRFGKYDANAPLRRNTAMAERAASQPGPSLLVAFWDGDSRGTGHMISQARSRDISVKIFRLDRSGVAAALVGDL
jgi:hypothetical protein